MDLPRLIAHRGAPRLAPENTLKGLETARAQGALWTEFDVTLSADGIPVVFHDDTLERTTDGKGPLRALTLAELKQLSAGRGFDPSFADCRIPTLAEYLTTAAQLGLGINVELKPIGAEDQAVLCAAVLDTLAQVWPRTSPTPLLSSFSAELLTILRQLQCPYPLALNTNRWSAAAVSHAQQLGCYSLHCNAKYLSEADVAATTHAGLHTLAYTVNDLDTATRLWSWGVTAIFSDIQQLDCSNINP